MRSKEVNSDRARTSPRGALLFIGVVALYLLTATYGSLQSWDPSAAALPSWTLAEHGTLDVSAFAWDNPWFVPGEGGVYSNRFPGVILAGVPFYWIAGVLPGVDDFSFVPSGVAAAVIAASAITVLFHVLRAVTTETLALRGALVAAFATTTWAVSADALWSHGVAQLALLLGLLAAGKGHLAGTGLAHATAVLTRPHLAVVPFVVGLFESWRRRSLWPAVVIGALAATGLAAVVLWNFQLFGEITVSGGRPNYAEGNLAGMPTSSYALNWWWTLFSPLRGILFYSPFVILLLPGLRPAWQLAPPWVRSGAVAGVAYMALQLRVNDFSGGDAFFAYRLPLEMLTLLAPLMMLCYVEWAARTGGRRIAMTVAVTWSVAWQAFGATVYLPLVARSVG